MSTERTMSLIRPEEHVETNPQGLRRGSPSHGTSMLRGRRMLGPLVVAFFLVCAIAAQSAMANRSYNSNIPGFNSPSSVAFDAAGNVWVSDAGHGVPHQRNAGANGVYKYNPFPSQTLLEVPNTFEALGGFILDLDVAVDQTTEEVFVSQSNGRTVEIFGPMSATHPCARGETICFSHEWTAINGTSNGAAASAGIHIAIDNSSTFSRGRVYLSLTEPENDIEVFDSGERAVDFPATAKYIKANKLTGTPSGPFGQVQDVTVDSAGISM